MEEPRKECTSRAKRPKHDHVSQAMLAYLQRRNYPSSAPQSVTGAQLALALLAESEASKPNSISYSCVNSEPATIDHNFAKLLAWARELRITELDKLLAPLFCHLYFEILQRGHEERAGLFYKTHSAVIDSANCEETVQEVLNSITCTSGDLSNFKAFRSHKYVVALSTTTVVALKKFLCEASHVVMLQVLQSYFHIKEVDRVDMSDEESLSVEDKVFVNGHALGYEADNKRQKLLDAIEAVKKEQSPLYSVHLSNVKDEVTAGRVNTKGGYVVYSYGTGIFVKSIKTLTQLSGSDSYNQEAVIRSHRGKIFDFSLIQAQAQGPDLLVSASDDKTVRLFDLSDYSEKTVFKGHAYPVYCVSASSNGYYVASGSYDRTARLWSVDRSDTLRLFAGHSQEITSISFHPNSTYLSTGSADKAVRMWAINEGNPVRLLLGSKGVVYALCHSSCGKFVASAGEDKKVIVWDVTMAKQLFEINTGNEVVTKLAWSADKKLLAAGTVDGAVKMWEFDGLSANSSENTMQSAVSCVNLNHRLLSLEYHCETFTCLTAQTQPSTLNAQ